MDTQELIRVVTREVIKRLGRSTGESTKPKVLVILTGASGVGAKVLPQLKSLGNLPLQARIVLSSSAETCLGKDFVASGTGLPVTTWKEAGDPLTLARENDLFILPALTQNTAASIALGLRNTPTTDLVAWAVIAGKPVIAVPDGIGAGPDELALLGARSIPATYRVMLERHMKTIESFGIKLVEGAKLVKTVESTLGVAVRAGSSGAGTSAATSAATDPVYRARVLAERDLEAILAHGEAIVVISTKTLVTPLARDLAASKNIRIIREGEQP